MKNLTWVEKLSSVMEPLRAEAVSVVIEEDSRRLLAEKLLMLQAKAIRQVKELDATDDPADIAEAFAHSVFERLCG